MESSSSEFPATASRLTSNLFDARDLPWISRRDRTNFMVHDCYIDGKPGEFVIRTLFTEFTYLAEKKIDSVLSSEPLEKPISKSLQRGEDVIFDQLLTAFGSVGEHCLPSLLKTLFAWYDKQMASTSDYLEAKGLKATLTEAQSKGTNKSNSSAGDAYEKSEKLYLLEKRDLAVEFIFCLFLIEVLKRLPLHPGHEDLVNYIENLAFKHFRFREGTQNNPNIQNINIIADLYAEVIGVLAQARFQSVRKRFMSELKELRNREPSVMTTHSIINLLMGMKFFRIKMVPIEQFEASFEFMHECAHYFMEVKDKDIKHALAGLFVEILVPVAATVKNEVNVPCLKNFVEMLYPMTLDLCVKKKHTLALFPLVTCLLCVSQKQFFLKNWHCFLSMCLSHLKNRDNKMSRAAFESLYRLLWVYMIRIKCESNTATQSKLQSIVYSLFPKGSKAVVPRDTPLNIFVKIIQFIAQGRLDFAMKGIVYDLLSVDRPIKVILAPERMSIGLRAFLVIADSLQQKEGEPPMPRTAGVMPSGNTLRVKKTFLNKLLTEKMAKNIGVNEYYPHVRKALNDILRALDLQFGKPLMMTTVQNANKEPDDMISGERKPKIDLFRACIAAVPRLIPDGMSRPDLIDLLSRLTVHMDEELRGLAFQALQNIINDFPDWREEVIEGFMNFMLSEINDTFPQLLDNALRMFLQLLTCWKTSIQSCPKASPESSANKSQRSVIVLHRLEAVCLVMLSSCRQPTRRIAAQLLKEARVFLKLLPYCDDLEEPVLDVIDKIRSSVLETCLPYIPANEKATIISSSFSVDLQWLAERNGRAWLASTSDNSETSEEGRSFCEAGKKDEIKMNAWSALMTAFMSEVSKLCTTATFYCWSLVCQRMNSLFTHIDTISMNDNRASVLLRGAASNIKKSTTDRDSYLALWKNYLMLACSIAPSSSQSNSLKHISHDLSSSPDSMTSERSTENKSPLNRGMSAASMFGQILPHLKSEHVDLRNATIFGLSHVNPYAVKELMEELIPYIREAIDRNKENNRKRKARDTLRVQLGILLELMAERKIFGVNLASLDREADGLNSTFVEYIDGMRLHLENEMDKENALIQEIRTRFCGFLTHLIKSFPLENRHNLFTRDLRNNLFNLLAPWSGKYSHSLNEHKSIVQSNQDYDLEFVALSAMSSLICCGPVFDDACLSSEESNIYAWLSSLLSSKEERVQKIGHETLVLLLEFNPDVGYLLDWCVDCCYSQNVAVADQCFTAIATIFSLRDYPCDHYMAILNLTLMNTSCPRASVQETAFHLLQVLDYRFFGAGKKLDLNFENEKADKTPTNFDRILENDDSEYPDYLGEVMLRKKNKEEYKSFEPLVIGNFPINQFKLSQRMAKLHADITMPLFSEITFRLRVARPSICRNMLSYLKPWLADIELVDSFTYSQGNPVSSEYDIPCNQMCDENIPKGWGCAEATEMILNNLFYLTVKSGGDYPEEIEELWYCLCHKFTNNMRVIIRYLFIVTSLSPTEILPHAKRVVLYMARARPERLIDEMMIELQTVEYLNCSIERTETPPFFRVTARKENGHSEEGTFTVINCEGNNKISSHLEQGTLHTKRHSTESGLGGVMTHSDNIPQTGPTGALSNAHSSIINKSDRTCCINEDASVASFASITEESLMLLARIAESEVSQIPSRAPHPLPMPEFGGYYAPLTEFLPDNNQPVTTFHRCNLSLTFLCDIILDGLPIDWTPHVPIMLHIIFLGLDHPKPIVHEHCKQLLRNLLIVLCQHNDPLCIARSILNSKTEQLDYDLLVPPAISQPVPNFTEPTLNQGLCIADCSRHNTIQRGFKMPSSLSLNDLLKDTWSCGSDDSSDNSSNNCSSLDPELSQTMDLELLVKCLVHYLSSKRGPLWNCEDITAKVWSVRSAAQLTFFLDHVLIAFKEFLVQGRIEERWAEIALQLALSCSSRHYAGRSLQIFRAIKLPVNSRMLADILSRLVETVAEQGEDMQGYVTELMLTLESAVDSLDSERKVICEYVKSLFKPSPSISIEANKLINSNPPLSSNPSQATITSNSCPNSNFIMNRFENSQNHARSVSFTTNLNGKRLPLGSPVAGNREMRLRSNTETDLKVSNRASLDLNIGRSRSAQVLKSAEERVLTPEDRISLLSQLFWISVAMLETDYEHEFLLALRLMARILSRLPLDRNDSQEKIEKVMLQSKWTNFPGVHAMLLKGCTSVSTFKMTMVLLHKMTPFLEYSFIDPSETTDSFPFNVIAMLPYMLASYDDPNPLCIQSSKTFADWCTKKLDNLENLATIMTLYSKKSFSKQSFQWTKCVVKYLFDAYSHVFPSIVSFLVEVMDRGPPSLSSHILSILQCILHYMDIATSSYSLKSDLHRIAHKYIEGSQWKDALKILKLVVTRSSTLAAAPSYSTSNYSSMSNSMPYSSSTPVDTVSIASGASFADSDFGIRRELPGRTIEFTYELDQTPIIGRRYMQEEKDTQSKSESEDVKDEASLKNSLKPCEMKSDEKGDKPASSPRRSLSYNHSFNEGSHWKRPWLSQSRTRERLIGLLKSFGKSVGLPKSPSVIFSQNSDVVEKQSSMGSSTEDLSVTNNDASAESKHEENCSSEQFLAKEFDFLEDELESKDGDGGDIFNWGVLQRPTNLGDTPENDFRSGSPSQSGAFQNIPQKEDLSSDDDGGSVSPTYEGLTDLSISALYSSSS